MLDRFSLSFARLGAGGRVFRDPRFKTFFLLVLGVGALGYGFSLIPARGIQAGKGEVSAPAPNPPAAGLSELAEARQDIARSLTLEAEIDPKDADGPEVRAVLKAAENHLKSREYDKAIATMNKSVQLLQKYPESFVLLGRALEGKKDYATARDFYRAAIDRNPFMYDAYWGFATASEGLGDLESALGAMRSYLHTEPDKDPKRLRIAQARSALWEWESKLGRGPWGPTKGIPPGFTADELKRDGRGVAVKMPIPGTEQPDGSVRYEIKHQDKFKLYPRP